MILDMRATIRALRLTHFILICPVLFLGCSSQRSMESTEGSPESGTAAAPAATVVQHVDAKGAQKLLSDKPDVVVLDVRTPEEFAGGHVAKAVNLDFNAADFKERLAQLDRNKTYVVHCAAGGRSTRSLGRFQELGFKSVVHLDGGFNGWVQAGLPAEK